MNTQIKQGTILLWGEPELTKQEAGELAGVLQTFAEAKVDARLILYIEGHRYGERTNFRVKDGWLRYNHVTIGGDVGMEDKVDLSVSTVEIRIERW